MKHHPIFILAVLLLIAGCDKHKRSTTILSEYPLQSGNVWIYDVSFTHDTGGGSPLVTNYTYTFRCAGDTVINGVHCSQLIKTEVNLSSGSSLTFSHYYKNQSDGFYFIGGDSLTSDLLFFKKENIPSPELFFKKEAVERGIFVCDQPLKILSFPVNLNDSWISNEYGSQSHFGRRYEVFENVTVPAGSFYCANLRPYFDNDNNGTPDSTYLINQWYSDKGLVKQSYTRTVTDYNGNTSTFTNSAVLNSVNF